MTSTHRPPVLLLHGLFGRPGLLDPWVRTLERAGYEIHTPTLPGRDPIDEATLAASGVRDYFAVVSDARAGLDQAPVIIGHSMGGLLGQKLAAETETAALVLLASIPPGALSAQIRSIPHLFPLLPGILAGRAIRPSDRTMRAVPLSSLPTSEQDDILPQLVPDAGRVFRSMMLGTRDMRVTASAITCPVLCVSGTDDRNVSSRTSRAVARRYGAEHQIHDGLPHWIVAESLLEQVAPPVLAWLDDTLGA